MNIAMLEVACRNYLRDCDHHPDNANWPAYGAILEALNDPTTPSIIVGWGSVKWGQFTPTKAFLESPRGQELLASGDLLQVCI